uniref:Rx N-terminal domain-containing protein n=1 Tax=Opuntia streptacantha TaxID=393608 RepID=A0A7C9AM05_OPUST
MAGAFLSAVIRAVFERLFSSESVNFFRRSKIDPVVEELKRLLLAAERVANDAEQEQITDRRVKRWVDQLKHCCYRAEELIDDIAAKALESSVEWSPHQPPLLLTKGLNIIDSVRRPSHVKTVTFKMKEIIRMLEILLIEKDALRLTEISARRLPQREPTTSFCQESELYGRVEERDAIVEFLLSEEPGGDRNRIGAVAIVGMVGIGKTALAQLIFNNGSVREAFDLRVWVGVSDEFDICRVTRSILESVAQLSYSTFLDLNFLLC